MILKISKYWTKNKFLYLVLKQTLRDLMVLAHWPSMTQTSILLPQSHHTDTRWTSFYSVVPGKEAVSQICKKNLYDTLHYASMVVAGNLNQLSILLVTWEHSSFIAWLDYYIYPFSVTCEGYKHLSWNHKVDKFNFFQKFYLKAKKHVEDWRY